MSDVIDPASRVEALLRKAEPRFATSFRLMVAQIRSDMDLDTIADLLQRGRLEEALTIALRRVPNLGTMYMTSFVAAAQDTASFLNRSLEQIVIDFDQTNQFAVEVARQNRLRLVQQFSAQQREATRTALLEGIAAGNNPRAQARAFRDSIGLTSRQVRAVNNYRRLLEEGSQEVFDRALRDKRFDSAVRRAILDGKPLTRTQIERMVARYNERYVSYRSRVIARTEALKSVHEGKFSMYQQAIENGDLDPRNLMNEWNTTLLDNVRDSHQAMHGQTVPFGELFVSGLGNAAPYPGAFGVPEEDIQCACAVGTRIVNATAPAGVSVEILT